MSNANSEQHVYQRTVSGEGQDSLSIIANLIEPGQTLLDLGMGTGGLGQYLSSQFAIVADGVTLNQAEADIAGKWYRQVKVADLDLANLAALFEGQRYDCIVCADVLEHLKAPQQVLGYCKALLKPGGRLITSVPNAGYCGLVAELMQGEFRYRAEGLLDSTHLRFFTRTSLERFFNECGWQTQSVITTQRGLLESEFKVAFDSLPPAIARYLLAMPDALTYQFVTVLQPAEWGFGSAKDTGLPVAHALPSHVEATAMFSAQLYLATQGRFNENTKLVSSGEIGLTRQNFSFEIGASPETYTTIRLDPADRPGFFKLYGLQLRLLNGDTLWRWDSKVGSIDSLKQAHHNQILWQQPWELGDSALLFLYGDDPWLELPLTDDILIQVSQSGARLEVVAGWPMSADYLAASTAVKALEITHQQAIAQQDAAYQEVTTACEGLNDANADLSRQVNDLNSRLSVAERQLQNARAAKITLTGDLQTTQLTSQARLKQNNDLLLHLQTIEQSTVFRATRPLVAIKMKMDHWFGKPTPSMHHNVNPELVKTTGMQLPLPTHPVDIIVPVYRGLDDTRCCIESVLQSDCSTSWRLIIINDCSPEIAVSEWLRAIALTDSRIELLENTENLGFVATVNRGMAMSEANDVLLLNSDAEVANNWLDRIQRAAYSSPRVASVTPFSNNATICSYPRFCMPNDLPAGHDTASLDKVFAEHLAGQTVTVPTGVGFCMYIRRECLAEVGLFDVANFGKGYGEENDFCVRAQLADWSHLHALDTFVRHAGGISFGDSKNDREQQAMVTLNRLHPKYEGDVNNFVQLDPARTARMVVDIARITNGSLPVVLCVTHNREGGTLRHIQELAQYLTHKATYLRLSPAPKGVVLKLEGPNEAFELHFALPQEHASFLQTLRRLQVGHIHYHHLLGHVTAIANLPTDLGVTHDFTAHDYYSYCPQISLTDYSDNYCGEQGLAQCKQCLQRNPAPDAVSIEEWRDQHVKLLVNARYLITPSHDTASRMQKFVPTANVCAVAHSTLIAEAPNNLEPKPQGLTGGRPLRVAVLGALSKIKGADMLEAVATLAAGRGTKVEFHLIGYAYRNLRTQPKAKLTVHGAYEDQDLPQLLQWLAPDLVWFPALWPETYSYTLSACLESGMPVVAPNIGAFAERLQGRRWTWLADWQQSSETWLAFFESIKDRHFSTGISPDPIETAPCDMNTKSAAVSYHGNYLAELPAPQACTRSGLVEIQKEIEASQPKNGHPSAPIKSSALRAIIHLRASALMSPMAKLVPMHMQRRVKSWLRR